jgi:hypothetical protein
VLALFLARLKGALGTVGTFGMTAPEPSEDSAESPITLNAITLALTELPTVKLNGDALNIEAGIVQVRLEITFVSLTPSQCDICY